METDSVNVKVWKMQKGEQENKYAEDSQTVRVVLKTTKAQSLFFAEDLLAGRFSVVCGDVAYCFIVALRETGLSTFPVNELDKHPEAKNLSAGCSSQQEQF